MRDSASAVRKKMRFHPRAPSMAGTDPGKPCCTFFRRIRSGRGLSLLAAFPETGRTHQIRATLLAMGYPVVGDKIYGVDERLYLRFIQGKMDPRDHARLRLKRQALHAGELHVEHPETGRVMKFLSPLPKDMQNLIGE